MARTSTTAAHRRVPYVLLAEFDIDKGSMLRQQYPRDTGVDEQSVPFPCCCCCCCFVLSRSYVQLAR